MEFQSAQTEGEVRLSQEAVAGSQGFNVTGEIRGLLTGQYVLLLVNLSPEGCQNIKTGPAVSEIAELYSWDQGTGDVAMIDNWVQGELMPDKEGERRGLLVKNCTILNTGIDCRRGEILECAEISWPSPGISWHIWLIISAAVFLLVVILLCIPLICYCVKRYPVSQSVSGSVNNYSFTLEHGGNARKMIWTTSMKIEASLPCMTSSLYRLLTPPCLQHRKLDELLMGWTFY